MNANPTLTPQERELQDLAERGWDKVLQRANWFMYNCKNFPISFLKLEDPSYLEIALIMKSGAGLIREVSPILDPMLENKIQEYCELMLGMAVAIENGDEVQLSKLVEEMERKSGVL